MMWIIFFLLIWYIMGGRSPEDFMVGLAFALITTIVLEREDIHSHLGDISRTLWKYPITFLNALFQSIVLITCFFCPVNRRISHKRVHTKNVFSSTINITATPMSIVFDYDSQSGELYVHEVLIKWK